jgi:hypothetical protein
MNRANESNFFSALENEIKMYKEANLTHFMPFNKKNDIFMKNIH